MLPPSKLPSLTPTEKKVLYYKCQGLKYEAIAKELNYSIEWVTLEMGKVYRKLGFKKEMHWTARNKILKNEICPNVPENLEEWLSTEEIMEAINEPVTEPRVDPEITALVLYDEREEAKEKGEQSRRAVEPPVIHIPRRPQLP